MLTESQLHILQHSLGANKYGQGTQYRNYYCIGPDGDSFAQLQELCAMGLMIDRGVQSLTGGMHVFQVTAKGKQAMRDYSPKPPKPKQSEQFRSWRTYCDIWDKIPFSQFLREVWPHRNMR